MSLNEENAPQPKNFTLAREGQQLARCVGLIDLGIQQVSYKGELKDPAQQVEILFELPFDLVTIEKEGEEAVQKPRWISKRINVKNGEKATLTKLKKRLGLNKLLDIVNLPVWLTIEHKEYVKDGETKKYAGIAMVSPYSAPIDPTTGQPSTTFVMPELVEPPRLFDFDSPSKEVWDKLPDFQKDYIKRALNFDKISGVAVHQATKPAPVPPVPPVAPVAQAPVPPVAQAPVNPAPVAAPPAPVAAAPVPQAPVAQPGAIPAAPSFDDDIPF